jgi:hypothetical protein
MKSPRTMLSSALLFAAVLSVAGVPASGQIIYTHVGAAPLPPMVPAQGIFTYDIDLTRNGVPDFRLTWEGVTDLGPFELTITALQPGAGISTSATDNTNVYRLPAGAHIGPASAFRADGLAYRDFGPMLPAFMGNWYPGSEGYFGRRVVNTLGQAHYGWAAMHVTTGYPQYVPQFVLTAFAYESRPNVGIEAGAFCYANCDNSTMQPILNVEDFTCFMDSFAQAAALPHEQQVVHYANCDQSTTAPVLNVEDFMCFISQFAAGCP